MYDKWFQANGPIIFYTGNEGPVELFADNLGQAWKLAEALHGVVVFAEHRFFGDSMPCGPDSFAHCPQYLGVQQALADFNALALHLRHHYSASAVVTIGGSYGGLLAGWMRMKYPATIAAAIASSAPYHALSPTYDRPTYWAAVTNDTMFGVPSSGRPDLCAVNVNRSLALLKQLLETDAGQKVISHAMNLCPSTTRLTFEHIGNVVQATLNLLAMADYPFPSHFFAGSASRPLPPRPLGAACDYLRAANVSDTQSLLGALSDAVLLFINATGDVPCLNATGNPYALGSAWEYLVCVDRLAHSMPFYNADGWPNDMFWRQPVYDRNRTASYCERHYDVVPRFGWIDSAFGTPSEFAAAGYSHIIFVNGKLDPWHTGGVLSNLTTTLVSLFGDDTAHHEDLFWPHPLDTPSVLKIRQQEQELLKSWLGL